MLERHFWRTANQLDEIGKAMGRSTSESEDEPGKLIEEGDRLLVRLRRIIKYLGIQWKLPAPDESGVAELIRKGVERGESFEAINRTVEFYLRGFGVQKLGRPIASGESDGIALRALELHESDPGRWTWAAVADELLNCNAHKAHTWDSECAGKLKKAGQRLRRFLIELESAVPLRRP
jgi:hypothetical protein